MADKRLRVVVVDDTETMRKLLVHIVDQSEDMIVVGQGTDGDSALDLITRLRPDVLLMDIIMPRMDGLEATRRVMRDAPLPVVLVSASLETRETDIAFQAIKAGALTVLQKPRALNQADANALRGTLRAMASVKVIHHHIAPKAIPQPVDLAAAAFKTPIDAPHILAIAASTGGPAALNQILSQLPADFPIPVAIVQHISADFMSSMTGWLQNACKLEIRIAQEGERALPGRVYFAPGDRHLLLRAGLRFALDAQLGSRRYMPSCDVLLQSVALACGSRAIGIVLTGMGDDGANGLLAMRTAGASTIAQDEASSIVYGMPKEAALRGAAQAVLPLEQIVPNILNLVPVKV